ncbi:MAG TPA: hypothetical protein VF251_12665 [Pyrinomonadaceae bacterium]
MTAKRIAFAITLLLALTTTGLNQETGRSFSSANGLPDESEPYYFHFEFLVEGDRYKLTAAGRGSIESPNGKRRFFDLHLAPGDRLNRPTLYYIVYKEDLVLLSDIGDVEYGGGFIARLNRQTLNLKWKNSLAGFNVGNGLIHEGYAYVTSIGFIGKIDIESGKYAWRHGDLYRRHNKAFNSFDLPEIVGEAVVFRETPDPYRTKIAVITIDRKTGRILKIDT